MNSELKMPTSASKTLNIATCMVMFLLLSGYVLPGTSAAQKFYTNGRYGRRSDLPPQAEWLYKKIPTLQVPFSQGKLSLHFSTKINPIRSPLLEDLFAKQVNTIQTNGVGGIPHDMFYIVCFPMEASQGVFRCLDRSVVVIRLQETLIFNLRIDIRSRRTKNWTQNKPNRKQTSRNVCAHSGYSLSPFESASPLTNKAFCRQTISTLPTPTT